MTERRRVFLLIAIMAVVAITVAGTTLFVLYRVALEQQRERLVETAQSQARLMEAVARFDARYSGDVPGGAHEATLAQIRDAHERFKGFGDTGEFTLAKLDEGQIVFLLSHRHFDLDNPEPVPFASDLAEPMRRALSGESGTVIGIDYRGALVLAAHEPVEALDLGIVAKIDLAEIRAPFVRAGIIAALTAVAIVLVGAVLFLRVTEPLLSTLEESEERFRSTFEQAAVGMALVEPNGRIALLNQRMCDMVGYDSDELLALTFQAIAHADDRDADRDQMQQLLAGEISTYSIEKRYIRKDSSQVWGNQTVSAMRRGAADLNCLIVVIEDITRRKRAQDSLLAERARISMELHDSVIQSLYAVGLQLDTIHSQKDLKTGSLGPIIDSLRTAIDDIRQYIMDLGKSSPWSASINAYLLNEVLPGLHIPQSTSVEVDVPDVPLPFSPTTIEGIGQMVKEATSNAVRHASASRIKVIGRRAGGMFEITIVDDGQGFDLGAVNDHPGMGLRNLRKRAQIYGGQVRIDSTPDRGTTVTIGIPADAI